MSYVWIVSDCVKLPRVEPGNSMLVCLMYVCMDVFECMNCLGSSPVTACGYVLCVDLFCDVCMCVYVMCASV